MGGSDAGKYSTMKKRHSKFKSTTDVVRTIMHEISKTNQKCINM